MLKRLFQIVVVSLILNLVAASGAYAQETQSLTRKLPNISGYISDQTESANTYWIEGKEGVIVIDTQRALSKAREALAQVQGIGKPVVAIIATHPHPDHIAGIGLFKEAFPNAEVYASQRTINEIKNDTHQFIAYTKKLYGDNYPDHVFIPNRVLQNGETLNLAGVRIDVTELGPSESEAATVLYVPEKRALFVGDLVVHKMIPFLIEGRSGAWLKQLAELPKRFPDAKIAYPGHGFPGGVQPLLNEQTEYLQTMRSLVSNQLRSGNWDGKTLTDQAKKQIASAIEAKYPEYGEAAAVPGIDEQNANAVALELSKFSAVEHK